MRNPGVTLCDKNIKDSRFYFSIKDNPGSSLNLSLHCLELSWWLTGKIKKPRSDFIL